MLTDSASALWASCYSSYRAAPPSPRVQILGAHCSKRRNLRGERDTQMSLETPTVIRGGYSAHRKCHVPCAHGKAECGRLMPGGALQAALQHCLAGRTGASRRLLLKNKIKTHNCSKLAATPLPETAKKRPTQVHEAPASHGELR